MGTRFFLLMLVATTSVADDLNKGGGLPANADAKIASAIARSYSMGEQANMYQPKGATCSPAVSVINIADGAEAPREITTVVKGDVISVCK
jgi:hypothetical protein